MTNEPVKAPAGTILVIDDERIILDLISQLLEFLQFEVLTAESGEQGISVLQEQSRRIDCVILDLTMPTMDGITCFRALREIRPDLKVILSSGLSEEDARGNFPPGSLAGFLQKPYDLNGLSQEVNRVLNQ